MPFVPAILALGAIALGRALYPRMVEAYARRLRRVGPDGIIEGAAPIELDRPDAPAVLLLHGGGDTPQVVLDLAAHLHEKGFAVRAPLLPGHGRTLPSLLDVSADALHAFVRTEYESLRQRHAWVAVAGLSMGGGLAVQLAAGRDDIPALVLLAPYVAMPAPIRRLAETSGYWGWAFPYFSSFGGRSIHDPAAAARALGYGILTPAMLRTLQQVVNDATVSLPRVAAPTLVIQSREDNRIPVASAERAFGMLGAATKRLEWVEGTGHVITVDFGRERVFQLTTEWLVAHGGTREVGSADSPATG